MKNNLFSNVLVTEKILVTTDQVVAEYVPVPDYKLHVPVCRKSELVRDWCDKTSLVMNKLYPTILTETNFIDNTTDSLRTSHLNNNITIDVTEDRSAKSFDETKNSYKSCFSKRLSPEDLCISGIKILENTVDNNNIDIPKRISIYENFSLPGSPTNIVHANYNSKTNLRKNKNHYNINNNKESIMTCDNSDSNKTYLNDAMAVVENRTNEWLSNSSSNDSVCEVPVSCNTRRSSASSGVSSSFSGGSVAIASVEEEYKYEDKEEHVVLIEKRLLLSPVV